MCFLFAVDVYRIDKQEQLQRNAAFACRHEPSEQRNPTQKEEREPYLTLAQRVGAPNSLVSSPFHVDNFIEFTPSQ